MEFNQNIFYDEFKNKLAILDESLNRVSNSKEYDGENLNEIFRSIHTVKGTADLLGMFDIVTITHKAEDVLDNVREKRLPLSSKLCSLLKELKDFISLSVDNTSKGIYDDVAASNLTDYFEKEFDICLSEESYVEEKSNILVVEESSLNRYIIKKIAMDKGYHTFITNNGIDGLNKIKNNDIDLIFCDISSNNTDIKTMLKLIKSDIFYDHIPVVLIVNKVDSKLREYGQKFGAKAWVLKPINQEQIKSVIDKILSVKS